MPRLPLGRSLSTCMFAWSPHNIEKRSKGMNRGSTCHRGVRRAQERECPLLSPDRLSPHLPEKSRPPYCPRCPWRRRSPGRSGGGTRGSSRRGGVAPGTRAGPTSKPVPRRRTAHPESPSPAARDHRPHPAPRPPDRLRRRGLNRRLHPRRCPLPCRHLRRIRRRGRRCRDHPRRFPAGRSYSCRATPRPATRAQISQFPRLYPF